MGIFGKDIARGVAAGAAGTTALNGVSYLDALWRGRPSHDAPERLVGELADRAAQLPAPRLATLAKAAALGAATGARSTAGITALALTSSDADGPVVSRLGSRPGTVAVAAAAAGELVADKLPSTPSRLAARGLVPRVTLAAAAAAGVARRDGQRADAAALIASAAALAAATLGVRLRAAAASRFGSDKPGAFAEDLLAAALAWLGARRA